MKPTNIIPIAMILLFSATFLTAGQARADRSAVKASPKSVADPAATAGRQEEPAGSREVEQGKTEFLERCGFCHGPDALGASGPNLARSSLVRRDVNGNLIANVIRNGRPQKGMPAFSLSDSQIAALVAFLHARANEELFNFGLPKGFQVQTGNAEDGKAFFYGTGHCSSCHSPEGDLKNIASNYSAVELMGRIAYPGGTAARTVTVTTDSGSVLTGELVYLDEFTVSLRDKDGWVHTWQCKDVTFEVHDPLAEHKRLLEKYTDEELHNLFAYLESLK